MTNYLQGCDLTKKKIAKKRGCATKPFQRREKLNFKYKHYNNI